MGFMSIQNLQDKLWNWYAFRRKMVILGGLLLLASSFSFALGYLANRETARIPVIIEKCSPDLTAAP